jgi:hypothetical protein
MKMIALVNGTRKSGKLKLFCGVLFLLVLVACSGEAGEELSSSTSVVAPTEIPPTVTTAPEGPMTTKAVPTIVATKSENLPATSVSTAVQSPEPKETMVVATPSPTPNVPPAEHVNVGQVPYAESECSDKYPCNEDVSGWEARILVPHGFEANYLARVDDSPTSITFGPDGLLYVAGWKGNIYTINEEGNVSLFMSDLIVPTGIAFQPGIDKLYVSSRIDPASIGGEAKVSYIENGQLVDIIDGLPCCFVGMHGPNGIAFGADGFGYVGVGGRADHGEILEGGPDLGQQDELQPYEAAILRFSPDGSTVETYARGFRNPYDITWDINGELYATDNGRDGNPSAGDEPPDELHRVIPGGEHGYPWFDCPVCFSAPSGVEIIPPLYEFIPHSAATGITAYIDDEFPGYYNDLFTVLWSAFEGAQKVIRHGPDREEASTFATGFALPIDITTGPDGALYVADYATGIIFRISYIG